jgi:uncharacterized protein (TIGR02147 family)
MGKEIFSYRSYKTYLIERFAAAPNHGRGLRKALAEHLGGPTSHVSQVLSGNSQFTLEQAEGVNEFLSHSDEEAHFFLLLVQLARAGTPNLRKRLDLEIQKIVKQRLVLKDRLGVKEGLSREDQVKFYSSWIYGAIHVMLAAKKFQTKEAIAKHLGISLKRAGSIVDFLVKTGLAVQERPGRYAIGTARIHLGNDSDLISKFHTNWRVQAIRSMDREEFGDDFHYSSAISISEEDFTRIKGMLVKAIEEIKPIIRESEAEAAYSFAIDFFGI